MRLTLDEYSKHFKMSKEMINSKIRANKLSYIIDNGTTFIIVTKKSVYNKNDNVEKKENNQDKVKLTPATVIKQKPTVAVVLGLYQRENQQLKAKIVQLEAKIDKLIDDKEQMLRDEMSKIEQVYSAKDEQLRTVLELINTQLTVKQTSSINDDEILEIKAETQEIEDEHKLVELKKYLKTLDLENFQKKVIKKRFLSVYDRDIRVIKQNGKLYLDFSKYDYSDLLEY